MIRIRSYLFCNHSSYQIKRGLYSTAQLLNIFETLMKIRQSTREKMEDLKRTCLLKSIRFYECLIRFGTMDDQVENQSKTVNGFMPTLHQQRFEYARHAKPYREDRNRTFEELTYIPQEPIEDFYPRRPFKSAAHTSFRRASRKTISNIRELTAQSMTPAVKDRKYYNNNNKQANLSILTSNSQVSTPSTPSPANQKQKNFRTWRLRQKFGKTCQTGQKTEQPICPWQTSIDY